MTHLKNMADFLVQNLNNMSRKLYQVENDVVN